jgi:hypothetical protein
MCCKIGCALTVEFSYHLGIDSDTDSIDTSIDASGILDNPDLDEASYDVDMIEAWKKNRDLGWHEIGPLGKVHNTAIHIWADNYRYNMFKKRAGRVLGLDNDTCWNSWFLLLNVILEKQEHVKWYQNKHWEGLGDNYLIPEDWQILHDTRDFLQPFWKITHLTEGHQATLDTILFTMDVLHKHYQLAFES